MEYGVHIERPGAAQVDHLSVDPGGREGVGRLERAIQHQKRGHDGDVVPLTEHRRATNLGHLAPSDWTLASVQALVLMEDDRIVLADRCSEQAIGRTRGRGGDDLQPWLRHEPAFTPHPSLLPPPSSRAPN